MSPACETSMPKQKIKSKAKELGKNVPIDVESIEWSIKGLAWAVEEVLRMVERYFHSRVKNLMLHDVELITKCTLIPTEMGFRLIIDVDIPDETIMFFAFHLGKLAKLIKYKYASIKVAKYWRERKKKLMGKGGENGNQRN